MITTETSKATADHSKLVRAVMRNDLSCGAGPGCERAGASLLPRDFPGHEWAKGEKEEAIRVLMV